jgi:hypothetical protein
MKEDKTNEELVNDKLAWKETIHLNYEGEIESLQSQLKEVKRLFNIEKKVRQSLEERVKILEQEVVKLNYCNDKLTEIINKRLLS